MNVLLVALSSFVVAQPPAADTWPGFRGRGDNIAAARNLPITWSPKDNIVWQIDIPGYGQSNPVVWKDRVFVTSVSGGQRDKGHVHAFDVRTGKRLWSHDFAPTQQAKWNMMISRAAPTPVVDAAALYTFFEGGNLLALSHDGKVLWLRSLVTEYGEFQNNHGIGSSLAQTKDAVLVLIDHKGPSYLLAVDKKTGKDLWKTERTSRNSWTSPTVASLGDREEVIVSSGGSVAGYDARTGKLSWELDGLSGNTLPSACVAGDHVVIGSGMGRMGGDIKQAAKSNCCLKLVVKDGKPGYEMCWQASKAISSYATPLVHRGHAYFVNQQGLVFCLDLATGKEAYAERIDSSCWASPLGAGDYIYFFGKDGQSTVLKAGPAFEKVATNRLWNAAQESEPKARPAADTAEQPKEKGPRGGGADYTDPILYGVAAIDGAFFVRTGTTLFRIGAADTK